MNHVIRRQHHHDRIGIFGSDPGGRVGNRNRGVATHWFREYPTGRKPGFGSHGLHVLATRHDPDALGIRDALGPGQGGRQKALAADDFQKGLRDRLTRRRPESLTSATSEDHRVQ